MKIILAPDSYKGSLSALEVSKFMEIGVKNVFPHSEIKSFPLADGGEGTVDSLVNTTNGKIFMETVIGPLGEEVSAKWGVLGQDHIAVIEMAEASGITLVPEDKLDPLKATSFGTGQLIKKALDHGCKKIILGIGGSATNDGGSGMAVALGAEFLDEQGNVLPPGGKALSKLEKIIIENMDSRILSTEFVVACDVTNPLCGPEGASAIFGPQKGANPDMVKELDQGLEKFGIKVEQQLQKNIRNVPGAGAAGGLGGGLMAFLNASLEPGIDLILDVMKFEDELENADLVLVGEGKTDEQTAFGKAPMGVAIKAKKYRVPVICISGSLSEGYHHLEEHGISAFFSTTPFPTSIEHLIANAGQLIEDTANNVMKMYKLGKTVDFE